MLCIPPLSTAARQAVGGHRAAKARELELFERLLAEKRYEPTEDEKRQETQLRSGWPLSGFFTPFSFFLVVLPLAAAKNHQNLHLSQVFPMRPG